MSRAKLPVEWVTNAFAAAGCERTAVGRRASPTTSGSCRSTRRASPAGRAARRWLAAATRSVRADLARDGPVLAEITNAPDMVGAALARCSVYEVSAAIARGTRPGGALTLPKWQRSRLLLGLTLCTPGARARMKQIPRRKVLQWGLGAGAMGALAACVPPSRLRYPTSTTRPRWPSTTEPPIPSTTTSTTTHDHHHDDDHHDAAGAGHEPVADRDRHGRRPRRQLARHPVRRRRVLRTPAVGVDPRRTRCCGSTTNFGLHPNLARSYRRPLALVEGLGHPSPDFSHSEMLRRWWFGDTDGRQFPRYGFLGRLCDVIATPNDAATGVSLGWGPSASLATQNAITLSMDPYGDGRFPGYDDPGMNAAWIAAHRAMSQEDRAEATMLFAGRSGIRTGLRFSDLLDRDPRRRPSRTRTRRWARSCRPPSACCARAPASASSTCRSAAISTRTRTTCRDTTTS